MGQDPDAIQREIAHTREQLDETVAAIGYKVDVPNRLKENVDDTVTRARIVVGDTLDTVKENASAIAGNASALLDATKDRVAQTVASTRDALPDPSALLDATKDRVAQTVASTRDALPDPAALKESASALAGQATAFAGNVSSNVGSVATNVSQNVASVASNVGENVNTQAKSLWSIAQKNPLGLVMGSIGIGLFAGFLVPVSDLEREKIGPKRDELLENGKIAAQAAVTQGVAQVKDRVMGIVNAAQNAPASGSANAATSSRGTTGAPSI